MNSPTILALLACGILAACSDSTGLENAVEFRTDRATYNLGDEGTLTLTNRHTGPIGANLCFASLERWTGSEGGRDWTGVGSRLCTPVGITIPPGDSQTIAFTVIDSERAGGYPFDQPGSYRFRTSFSVEGVSTNTFVDVFSNTFVVE